MLVNLSGIVEHSFVDGPGARFTIFFQGCSLHCLGCQNPDSWDSSVGLHTRTDDILDWIKRTKLIDGVTFSGGDPLEQPEAVAELSSMIKTATGLSVWCYTGRVFEKLTETEKACIDYVDVLVDGPYEEKLRSEDVIYRGSSNQRLIDVQQSNRLGTTVEFVP